MVIALSRNTIDMRDFHATTDMGDAADYGRPALDFVDKLSSLTSKIEVLSAVKSALEDFGFKYFVMSDMPCHHDQWPPHVLMIDLPEGWAQHYLGNAFEKTDPVVTTCRNVTNPFEWVDAVPDPRLKKESKVVMRDARDFGMRFGLSIPVHGLDGLTSCFSMSSTDQPFLNQYSKPALHLMGIYAFERVRELEADRKLPTSRLTDREREVLSWAAAGKSAATIADILTISERTVVFHTVNATQKLGAANKTEAVARALRNRLISF